jgi:hypothetical protein
MTDEEFAAAQKSAQARNQRFESGAIPQADSGTEVMRLTSLISDPQGAGFIVSTLGAILLLALYRLFMTHRHPAAGH